MMVTGKDAGVSPVIATILMVAITVVLAATLYMMVGNMQQRSPSINPPIRFVPERVGEHNWTLKVASNELNPIDLKYSILTKNYTYVVIAAQFPTTSGVNDTNGITWMDVNGDGKLDTGDSILINSNNIESRYYFKITAGAQGEAQLPY